MIISTREQPAIRRTAFKIGISQTSAGSVTTPGGYGKEDNEDFQFHLYDRRPLGKVIEDVLEDKFLPSFCTACYRSGRTGEAFMRIAKPGEVHNFCRVNGILTFAEYLEDYATAENKNLYRKGYEVIEYYLKKIENPDLRQKTAERLGKIREGSRDMYF